MLDLMGFKEEIVSQCRSVLCESGPFEMEVEERTINKAQRGMLNGLLFRKEGLDCAPTFYIEDLYNEYKEGIPIEDISNGIIEAAAHSMKFAGLIAQDSLNMIGDPERLRVRLLNKGRNKEYLKSLPCRELSCGFVYIAEIDRGEYSAVITKDLMKEYDLTEDELFDIAIRNTAENYPAVLQDLYQSAMGWQDECVNLLEHGSGRVPAGAGPGFVLTNSRSYWGAGALFYPGVIDRIHELLGGDFYVLPSSVHELIIIRTDNQDPKQLVELVRSANSTVVKNNEILADDLYVCESGKLSRVSYGGVIPPRRDHIC